MLAVVGVVVAFSLSSTLVKRAESPGVLVAFWRMITVSVVWNLLLWSTGRRITLGNVRQAFVPGVLFGLNLAVFFAGATHNSVANAALIGSLAPFLVVPVGAWLFREYIDPRALVFAVVAFGGVGLVLLSAPRNGDASLEGNVFGMSGTGWTYMLVLTFTSGVAAQGLLVFAQKTIQIGTIAIAQVAQPALAVVWSLLLLGEVVNQRQIAGIAIVVSGLLAFVVRHQRGDRTRQADEARATPVAGEGSGATV